MGDRLGRDLARVLRHRAVEMGLHVDPMGYVCWKSLHRKVPFCEATEEDLRQVVALDNKGRFDIVEREDGLYIRARQGHSGDVAANISNELALEPITTPCQAIHGTTFSAWCQIKKQGLKPMGRKHVHMAASTDASSGIRKNSGIHIIVNMEEAMNAGIRFFRSENGVILTPSVIPPQFLRALFVRRNPIPCDHLFHLTLMADAGDEHESATFCHHEKCTKCGYVIETPVTLEQINEMYPEEKRVPQPRPPRPSRSNTQQGKPRK